MPVRKAICPAFASPHELLPPLPLTHPSAPLGLPPLPMSAQLQSTSPALAGEFRACLPAIIGIIGL
ncbi:MAG: hypothetical protein RL105_1197 [Verrucomicrobiota bacterium]|jgi:hypothetical protein